MYQSVGVGLTEEQAVQEAASNDLSVYRGNCDYLANANSDFYHFPAADDRLEGCYVTVYSDPGTEPDRSHRALVELVRALDLRARRWYLYAVASRESQRATGTR